MILYLVVLKYIMIFNYLEQCVLGIVQGGEPDLSTVSKMVLNDWQRGRIPFFVKPPGAEGDQEVFFHCLFFPWVFIIFFIFLCQTVFCYY